jgi:hypothetical protein
MAVKVLNTLFYTVVVKHDVVWLRRVQKRYKLAVWEDGQLSFLSPKPRPFLDEEDEARISKACELEPEEFEEIGTVEITMELGEKGAVRLVAGGEHFATWSVTRGIRFEKDVHPIWKKDKEALAIGCAESLRGGSGIFEEPVKGNDVFSPTNLTKL